ncbi:hypothetical protein PSTT_13537 [Puccinia striiformis]|uniref:Uncharacterized protein n=1 Tax=Puccinia striiformis TaxID=27350 RepID=A0A2S4URJ6_9BASI|nr:hypothetical protein PSTT_13537 [Puccinia striiformis]
MSFPSRRVGPADDRMRPDDAAIRHHPTLADHIAHRAQERVTQELLEQLRRNINLSANATVRHIQRANTSSAQTPTNNTNQDPTYTQMALTLQSLMDMDKRLRNLFDAVIPEAGRINALKQPSMRNPDPPISSSDTDASPVGTEAELVEDQLPSRPVIESDGAPLNPESLPSNPPHQSLRTHTTTRNVLERVTALPIRLIESESMHSSIVSNTAPTITLQIKSIICLIQWAWELGQCKQIQRLLHLTYQSPGQSRHLVHPPCASKSILLEVLTVTNAHSPGGPTAV